MIQEQEQEEPFKNIIQMSYENYHIRHIFDLANITDEMAQDDDRIKNAFWFPNLNVVNMLVNYCCVHQKHLVLEIGPGVTPFPLSSIFIGLNEQQLGYISVNMNHELIPFDDQHFDFLYTRHFLEDIEFPQFAIQEIIRCSKSGYIETPSPIIEIMRGVNAGKNNHLYCGYLHHHSIIWGDMENNTLHILPKKSNLLENILYDPLLKRKLLHLANHYPVYWNQYFLWDGEKPQVRVYDEDECNDTAKYLSFINLAISCTLQNTRFFLEKLQTFQEPKVL